MLTKPTVSSTSSGLPYRPVSLVLQSNRPNLTVTSRNRNQYWQWVQLCLQSHLWSFRGLSLASSLLLTPIRLLNSPLPLHHSQLILFIYNQALSVAYFDDYYAELPSIFIWLVTSYDFFLSLLSLFLLSLFLYFSFLYFILLSSFTLHFFTPFLFTY